tara:strand:- start:118 stop:564 length:447 start_codon:yes stop_codon:yes gene_type:complete
MVNLMLIVGLLVVLWLLPGILSKMGMKTPSVGNLLGELGTGLERLGGGLSAMMSPQIRPSFVPEVGLQLTGFGDVADWWGQYFNNPLQGGTINPTNNTSTMANQMIFGNSNMSPTGEFTDYNAALDAGLDKTKIKAYPQGGGIYTYGY